MFLAFKWLLNKSGLCPELFYISSVRDIYFKLSLIADNLLELFKCKRSLHFILPLEIFLPNQMLYEWISLIFSQIPFILVLIKDKFELGFTIICFGFQTWTCNYATVHLSAKKVKPKIRTLCLQCRFFLGQVCYNWLPSIPFQSKMQLLVTWFIIQATHSRRTMAHTRAHFHA